jgi:hypothetical protein
LRFSFVFSWSLGYQIKNIRIVKYNFTSSNHTLKETTIIFVKVGNREKGKILKEYEMNVSMTAR